MRQSDSEMALAKIEQSPYLSSPIRPIPSFKRNRSHLITSNAKWSPSVGTKGGAMSMCSSSKQSTVASLRLSSPHDCSMMSVQSNLTHGYENRNRSLSRMILLPDDDLTGYYIFTSRGHETESTNNPPYEEKHNEDDYSTSDFDDDESISTNYANSVTDDTLFSKMKENGNDVFGEKRKETISQHNTPFSEKGIKNNEWTDIKLPAVNTRKVISATCSSDTQRAKINYSGGLINSPYAIQTKKTKIQKAKIKNRRKEPKEDFRF